MAHFPHQYGEIRYDKYGNPVPHTDDYRNPINHSGTTDFGFEHQKQDHGITGNLYRSSSSSSLSSSEDDGHGGRRKKGVKEKIKQKLPGHKEERDQATSTTTPGGFNSAEEHYHGKKGIMDKIKEKLPGGHHHDEQQHPPTHHNQHQSY